MGFSSTGKLTGADDVATNNVTQGQTIVYNSTIQKWVNVSPATTPGIIQLDDFAGANDDAKLTAAMDYAKAQTYIPTIQFPARVVTLSQTRTPYNGMRLIGPGSQAGSSKNLEINPTLAPGHVKLNVGNGASSWMVGNGDVHSIYIGNIAFWGLSTSQFWQHAVGSMYPAQFDSLTFFGFRHVFGNATTKCLMTQTIFTGHWQVIAPQDVQFNIGGSDNSFWMGGYLNIGSNSMVAGNGKFLIQFDWLGKTDVGKVYMTIVNGWLGMKISGTNPKLNFYGGEFEGQNINDPCPGSVIRVEGGVVAFFGPWVAYAMSNPGTYSHGVIEVTGGNVLIERPVYNRGNTAATVPLVYCSGGRVDIRAAAAMTADTPIVTKTGGTVINDTSVIVN